MSTIIIQHTYNTSDAEPSVCFFMLCMVVWRWQCCCPSQCLCQVSEADLCRARAVSAHSTCGLTQFDRTWRSSTGSCPVRKTHTHTHTRTHKENTCTKHNKTSIHEHVSTCTVQHGYKHRHKDNKDEQNLPNKENLLLHVACLEAANVINSCKSDWSIESLTVWNLWSGETSCKSSLALHLSHLASKIWTTEVEGWSVYSHSEVWFRVGELTWVGTGSVWGSMASMGIFTGGGAGLKGWVTETGRRRHAGQTGILQGEKIMYSIFLSLFWGPLIQMLSGGLSVDYSTAENNPQ